MATSQVLSVNIEISVVLGRCTMPMWQFLRMGRGAVIALDTLEKEPLWILANKHPIARGEIAIVNERLAIEITDTADAYEFNASALPATRRAKAA